MDALSETRRASFAGRSWLNRIQVKKETTTTKAEKNKKNGLEAKGLQFSHKY